MVVLLFALNPWYVCIHQNLFLKFYSHLEFYELFSSAKKELNGIVEISWSVMCDLNEDKLEAEKLIASKREAM